jgi:hypothetical protein
VPSSFRLSPAPYLSCFVALTFLPTRACSILELPFQENLSEGSVLFAEWFNFSTVRIENQ